MLFLKQVAECITRCFSIFRTWSFSSSPLMFWVPARIFEAAFCCSAFCVLACDVYPINKIATSRYLEEYLKTYMYTESTVVNLQIVRSCPSRLLFSPPKERKSQWNSLKALSLESVTLVSFIFQPGRRPFPYPLPTPVWIFLFLWPYAFGCATFSHSCFSRWKRKKKSSKRCKEGVVRLGPEASG